MHTPSVLTCTLIAGPVSSPETLCARGQTAHGQRGPAGHRAPRSSTPVNKVFLLKVLITLVHHVHNPQVVI